MLKRLSLAIIALLACIFAFESGARADFYAGKTITILVNYGPGSGADVLARVFAEHLRKHLAGNPTIIVENMPGAGGLAAQNALGVHIGSKLDGLTVGFFQVSTIAAIIGDPASKISISDLVIIGGLVGQTVAYARKDMPPGLARPTDIVKVSKIYAAGYSRSSPPDTKFRLWVRSFKS